METNAGNAEQENGGQKPAKKFPVVNLVIDIQDHQPPPEGAEIKTDRKPMDPSARADYLAATKQSIQELAEKGIPTIYIAIGDSSALYPGSGSDPDATRPPDLVAKLGLTGIAPGPEADIFLKRFMDTFTDIADLRASETLAVYAAGQRDDNILDTSGNIKGASFGEVTFAQHLKKLGVEHVTIMGSMAEFCITDNALGAVLRGEGIKSATILSDRVIGWNDDSYTQPVWHKDNLEAHEASIKAVLEKVRQDPSSRGFSGEGIEKKIDTAIDHRISMCRSADYVAAVPALLESLNTSPAESKFARGKDRQDSPKISAPQSENTAPKTARSGPPSRIKMS